MRTRTLLFAALLSISGVSFAASPVVHIYKREGCGCCDLWAAHLEKHGLKTRANVVDEVSMIRGSTGIPEALSSCHVATIGEYAIEGHVPASAIKRLLKEKPKAVGLAVAGMPAGSPGMEAAGKVPYSVLLVLEDGSTRVFSRH